MTTSTAIAYRPFLDSAPVLDDPAELRRRAAEDGYLFFRGLVDAESIRRVRAGFVRILAEQGWTDAGTNPNNAISSRPATWEGRDDYWPVFERFQRLESFHALPHHPRLIEAMRKLLGEPVLPHPRHIGRIIFPGTPRTPPHQDYLHIGGTTETWTAWLPLGDVSEELGPLAVLGGSHKAGLLPTRSMAGAGGQGIADDDLRGGWRSGPFSVGDVVFFHSLNVHAGTQNRTGNRLRLSCDFRYQGVSQPVHPSSLQPHMSRFDWPYVYEGWQSDALQRYWERMPLNVQPESTAVPAVARHEKGGGY